MKKLLRKAKDWLLAHPWKTLTIAILAITVIVALFRADIFTITALALAMLSCGLSNRRKG